MILTFDIEEWWSVESFKPYLQKRNSDVFNDRVEIGINNLLKVLNNHNVKGTFYFLGRVAEKYSDVVEEIAEQGHDIGTHGYEHVVIYKQKPREFENDLKKSINILNNITGQYINKYRAPSYTIKKDTLWALKILHHNGILYDSSMFNGSLGRFGVKNIPSEPFKVVLDKNSSIIEFPINSINLFNQQLPITSGFGFRFFPEILIKNYIKKHSYNLLVLHNWEFDIAQPKINAGYKAKLIHYFNLKNTLSRFVRLLNYADQPASVKLFIQNKVNEQDLPSINIELIK